MRGREDLAGIQEPARIEDALDVTLERDQICVLFQRQIRSLQRPDAMLSAQRTL